MIYSIVVWGFDNDNDYCHDCDFSDTKRYTIISVEGVKK